MLGATVRDRVSGVTGTVVGVVSWLNNPVDSLIVQPPAKDGQVPPTTYVPMPAAERTSPIPSEHVQ